MSNLPSLESLVLANTWAKFERLCLAQAGELQRREMKKAYYAGAAAMMASFKRVAEPDISEEVGEAHLDRIDSELEVFAKAWQAASQNN